MNRALSIRSSKGGTSTSSTGNPTQPPSSSTSRLPFRFATSLRGTRFQPELSRRLYRLIKSENNLIAAHESAARERLSIATQLSEWGAEAAGAGPAHAARDEAVSDIADKLGVVLAELGEQEDTYAHALDESRSTLKVVRNTEKSVQPSRDGRDKIAAEIAKVKAKEGNASPKLVVLEQELVRAEAENLVAEAQLDNITRQKLKEAYQQEFLATIERAEKQVILARHGLRLLQLLDDTPVVPGDERTPYRHGAQARQILNDAEDDLREWRMPSGLLGGDDEHRRDEEQHRERGETPTPPSSSRQAVVNEGTTGGQGV
ncbi:Eisosome component PIL1/LSP1 [Echria macrotheca]|uniref:Eisosome component PIL1/LSP1 n=1 Tax=Echria macrotheca TaxID=438768 RepID=A0AAJ0BBA3_9PEZI|nr:Eisosome component PIL1/LSP1 [Echria macrotheca]